MQIGDEGPDLVVRAFVVVPGALWPVPPVGARVVDRPGAARGRQDGGGSDVPAALAGRLGVPGPRPGRVARPRLLELLGAVRSARLTVVTAPAGYGKSTLLAQWLATGAPGRVGWVALDDRDAARGPLAVRARRPGRRRAGLGSRGASAPRRGGPGAGGARGRGRGAGRDPGPRHARARRRAPRRARGVAGPRLPRRPPAAARAPRAGRPVRAGAPSAAAAGAGRAGRARPCGPAADAGRGGRRRRGRGRRARPGRRRAAVGPDRGVGGSGAARDPRGALGARRRRRPRGVPRRAPARRRLPGRRGAAWPAGRGP